MGTKPYDSEQNHLYYERSYARHREARIAHNVAYKQQNPEKVKVWSHTRYEKKTDYFRNWTLQSRFGISLEQYQVLLEEQGGVCAICHRTEHILSRSRQPKNLAVDHDHVTGKVRGLLCHSCNTAVGHLETVERIEAALAYLRSRDS